MKRAFITTAVISVLLAGGMGSRFGDLAGQNSDERMDSVVNDIGTQAADEIKKAFANEVSEFFKSDDLSKTLGIDSEGQEQIEESLRTFIDQYSADEEKLSEAKASLDMLLQEAEGLSAEELQDRIKGIFAE